MLVETARLWFDLGFFSERKDGRFCIDRVTGPDEYTTVVDNNTYTNLMARENLRFAAGAVGTTAGREHRSATKPCATAPVSTARARSTGLAAGRRRMYVPYDED